MARSLRRRNEKALQTKLLDSRQTRRYPERDTRHGRTLDIQIQTGRDRSPLQGLTSQPLRSEMLHPNQERSLLRKFAPVASFVTLRLVFALTALPHFHVNYYDVSVAFIESELDDSTPPVYCVLSA